MKFLLIGAGIGQINLARKIKERGYYLLSIAYNSIPEVTNLCDKFIHHDLYDKEGVLELARIEQVDAVVSDQHDIMAPLVAYIAEGLGLPGNKYDQLLSYCNKNRFRDICDRIGIPSPKHCEVKDHVVPDSFKFVPFPWMVKPADSQSSVGVRKVNSIDEYVEAVQEALHYSLTQTAIVEEFFEGKELVAEGFIYKGEYYNLGFADRKYFNLPNMFIPSQTIFPSHASDTLKDSIILCESVMAAFVNPNFGIVHSEYLYNEHTGEYRIVESGLRGGGVFISSHLIPYYCGIDVNDILLDCAIGAEIDMSTIMLSRKNQASAYLCFYLPEGQIENGGYFLPSQLRLYQAS